MEQHAETEITLEMMMRTSTVDELKKVLLGVVPVYELEPKPKRSSYLDLVMSEPNLISLITFDEPIVLTNG